MMKISELSDQCSLEESFNLLSQDEIDEGYVYGRNFRL